MDTLTLFAEPPILWLETIAGVFFCVVVGKATRSESRLLMTATAACMAYPHPATLFAVGMLGVLLRALDFINLGAN